MTRHVDLDKTADLDPSSDQVTQRGHRTSETDGGYIVNVPVPEDRTIGSRGEGGPGSSTPGNRK